LLDITLLIYDDQKYLLLPAWAMTAIMADSDDGHFEKTVTSMQLK